MNSVLWLLSCSILSTSLLCNSSHISNSPVPVCVLKLAGESTDAQPFIGLDPQLTFLSLGCNVVSTISEYPILLITVQGNCLCCSPFGFPCISSPGASGGSEQILTFISVLKFLQRTTAWEALFQCLALYFKEPRFSQQIKKIIAKCTPCNIMAAVLSHWDSDIACICHKYVMGREIVHKHLGCICLSCCPQSWQRYFCQMVTN